MENNREKTPEEVEMAYSVARRLASSIMDKVKSSHDHLLDFDDYVQEGVLAWLEGRPMYFAMMSAFKKSAKMSPYSYNVKGLKEPYTLPIEYADFAVQDSDLENEVSRKVDSEKILQRIKAIKKDQRRFAVMAYLYFGMTLREIGEVFGKSHEWVRKYLIDPELKKLREEFK